MTIATRIAHLQQTIAQVAQHYQRAPGSVQWIAVSKGQPYEALLDAIQTGVVDFGENYYQEALTKINALTSYSLHWHFIGPIQRNKTRGIAAHFDWVHSLSELSIAQRLNDARETTKPPLNVCIQLNLDDEPTKAGIQADELIPFARQILTLPQLKLRGLMTIPKPMTDSTTQYQTFSKLTALLTTLNQSLNLTCDTLSMGMSDDLDEAIHAGSTCLRIGRFIFGNRPS